ncbi:transcriptional regulator [Streptomyces sp. SID10853]|uniref:transcriptional regulator n=1 Tax=Streptomyces sp. SID10853 TaxID=2706028 RepID=UPI0013C27B20|nr:transcriptional regulator [Streptomyces sp. SID10853]NDZ81645.1 transcriptional regulator [Streptomyces sp. SID10853]
MDRTALDVLKSTTAELAPGAADNRLVPLIAAGTADRRALSALALEQRYIIESDRSAFTHLAERSAARRDDASAVFFAGLAGGENTAAERLETLIAACGPGAADVAAYEPMAGCQAYPSYVARLALTAAPAEAALALTANFAAWGGYCATIADGLRTHYGFDDAACGFFDFFAEPAPGAEAQAAAAVQAGLDSGPGLDTAAARRHGRLLRSYELMFWNTLAELA